MTKKIRKPLSIILSLMMILSVFTIIPVTSASAAEETITLNSSSDKLSNHGIQNLQRGNHLDFDGSGLPWGTFVAPAGKVFTKIVSNGAKEGAMNWTGSAERVDHNNMFGEWYIDWETDTDGFRPFTISFTLADAAPPTYTVTWKNWDGSVLETDEDVAEGATPEYNSNEPTKPEDDENTYEFAGWTPDIAEVTADAEYTATFTAVPKQAAPSYVKVTEDQQDWSGDYLIVYEDKNKAFNGSSASLDDSGNHIDVDINDGKIESDATTDAAKVTIDQIDGGYSIATAKGVYIGGRSGNNTLVSSNEAILNTISIEDDSAKIVSNSTTFQYNPIWKTPSGTGGFRYYKSVNQKPVQLYKLTGAAAPTTYTVTWKNYDGSVLETDADVAEGATPEYNSNEPTKAEDEDYTYEFAGWTDGTNTYGLTDTLPGVTADVTYTAVFDATEKSAPVGESTFYVVGTFTNWQTDDAFAMTKNDEAEGEYMLSGVELSKDDMLKVVETNGSIQGFETKWYPDGTDNDYVIPADGVYDIYFRPNYDGGDDWYYNCIYVADVTPAPTYTITDASVNGTVTASVNGTGVTEAEENADVTLTVAPAEGYQFKSITATCAKNGVENLGDLIALMGDAVADGYDGEFDGYTFKVEDGKFVIYNGSTLFAELSESDVTDFQVGDEIYAERGDGDEGWYFALSDNKITGFYLENYLTGDYFFTNEFESTGTLPLAELALTTVTEGSQYSFTMPNKPVTVTAVFEEAPAPTTTETTVVWDSSTGSFDQTVVQVTGEGIQYYYGWYLAPETETGTFTTSLEGAKFTKIEISGGSTDGFSGEGWSGRTWTGEASSVPFGGFLTNDGAETPFTITFTLSVPAATEPTYTVTWNNYDGTELEKDESVEKDSLPKYDSETPAKAEDDDYTYEFAGWTDGTNTYGLTDTLPAVTGDVTYTAVFEATPKVVHVPAFYVVGSFTEWQPDTAYAMTANAEAEGEYMLTGVELCEGDMLKIVETDDNITDFTPKWYPDGTDNDYVIPADGVYDIYFRPNYDGGDDWYYNCIYVADVTPEPTYTVTWKNWDGSVLETDEDVAEGATPEYNGNEPTKPEDDDYTYEFAGWTPEVVAATADAEYTATFTATDKHVAAVISMINALPEPQNVTVNDKDSIEAAGYAYANLSNAQRALVPAESVAKLQAVAEAFAIVAKEAADQAAADGVTYLINQIPAEVTENDREAVENARRAYNMLDDDQKKLIDDDVLAKLLAAEYALDPDELVNTSTLESELIATGGRIVVNTSAEGGFGDYTYQIYYKRSYAKYWTLLKSGTSFKVNEASDFIVRVVVTDQQGNSDEIELNASVRTPLTNTSTAPGVDAGERAVIYGSAEGGAGGYTYTYYYKNSKGKVWKLLGTENTTDESVGFKTKTASSFDVKVIVTDSEGTQVEKLMTLGVRGDGVLKNNTTISETEVTPGTKVHIYTAAEGGTESYTWSVRYKRPSGKRWIELAVGSNGVAQFTPNSVDNYEVIAELIDADGTSIVKEFTVEVANWK